MCVGARVCVSRLPPKLAPPPACLGIYFWCRIKVPLSPGPLCSLCLIPIYTPSQQWHCACLHACVRMCVCMLAWVAGLVRACLRYWKRRMSNWCLLVEKKTERDIKEAERLSCITLIQSLVMLWYSPFCMMSSSTGTEIVENQTEKHCFGSYFTTGPVHCENE